MSIRHYIRLLETLLNEYRPPDGGLGYHGTTSKFASSILKRGFRADPEFKTYDGNFTSYPGTYFSDSFAVALSRGGMTVEKFGGKTVVFICSIDVPVAGDEDGVIDFLQDDFWRILDDEDWEFDSARYREDEVYREDVRDSIGNIFEQHFGEQAPAEFWALFLYVETGGSLFDDHSRGLIDRIAHAIGPATPSNGNPAAKSFRVPGSVEKAAILAVVQCTYTGPHDQLDSSSLPRNFRYKVIYGEVPAEVQPHLQGSW